MENRYLKDIIQTNGCRKWINPLANTEFVPESTIEIFLSAIPKDQDEEEIFFAFERFGPIYQFRLMTDFNSCNRGFAYLIYFYDNSALQCLDLMGYFIPKKGNMLDVEISQKRSKLLALNIPPKVKDEEIEKGFRQTFPEVLSIQVKRDDKQDNLKKFHRRCTALLSFSDHESALAAKQWSCAGSVHCWSRDIKFLWDKTEPNEDLKAAEEVKHVLIHNVPENIDPEEFGAKMCELVSPRQIISIRPMRNDCLIEFASTAAALTIYQRFNGQQLNNQIISTEWVTHTRLKSIASFADFDFELRCFCIANYCNPPVFVYGCIIPWSGIQLCSVIIKNNRNNSFVTFFIEIDYKRLVDIHARVCEVIVLLLMQLKELPKKNLVIKCSDNFAIIVGAMVDMKDPKVIPSSQLQKPIFLSLDEIFALSKMSYTLIASEMLDDIYYEYKMILKEKNLQHQFICGIFSDGHILGCIDPIYRGGKPLKYQLDSRHMILAMCDTVSLSNMNLNVIPFTYKFQRAEGQQGISFNVTEFEMIPIDVAQNKDVHFAFRPFIEFNQVDTFGPLQHFAPILSHIFVRQPPSFDMEETTETSTQIDEENSISLENFMNSLLL